MGMNIDNDIEYQNTKIKLWTTQGIPLTGICMRWRDESIKMCLQQCLV